MSMITEAEELALKLSDSERARLAERLIASLPSPFEAEDEEWVEEALRRDKEMDDDPESVLSQGEFFQSLREYVQK